MPQLRKGEKLTTAGRTIGEGDVSLFAGLVGDFTPIHVDAVAAAASPHGVRIAHGPLAMSTAIGMMSQTGLLGERVIGLVNVSWNFSKPVRIGDTIRAHVEVEDLRPTSKPQRNLATIGFEVVNQTGAAVQTGRLLVVVHAD